jgi:hypothetical protein
MTHFRNIVQIGTIKFAARMNEGNEPISKKEIELGRILMELNLVS